jgi:putative transposase
MQRSHKIALDLTNVQATGCAKAAGCARVAYNWALNWWKDAYREWQIHLDGKVAWVDEKGKERLASLQPTEQLARLNFDMIKGQEFPWMYESTKCAPQEAIRDLGKAFSNFFAGRANYPKRHKKGVNDSFRLSPGQYAIQGKKLRIPNVGWVRMREELRFPDVSKTYSVTISKHRGRWFASIACEVTELEFENETRNKPIIGVDLGTDGYALSTSEIIATPRAYRTAEKQLRRAQRSLSRKKKGSANRRKAQVKVNLLHAKVGDTRNDWLHKLTNDLVTNYSVIGIENLNVKGMSARPKPKPDPDKAGNFLPNKAKAKSGLNKSILDAAFGEFRRQLEYKAPRYGAQIIIANRWFPSSKTCNVCGEKTNRLTSLKVRKWECDNCGTSHHRDINAAINLRNYAVSSTVSACGEFSTADLAGSSGGSSNLYEAGTKHQNVREYV